MTIHVALYVFDDVEVLDFAGPFEVFTTASRVASRSATDAPPPFVVHTVARQAGLVRARAGLMFEADHTLATCPPCELLLIPGGVIEAQQRDAEVVGWIAQRARTARWTASICTGAFLLAQAGLLDGRPATTHWEDLADLQAQFPQVQVTEGPRWVDNGDVITSAGISAGIDMSLHLVARLASPELAERTARQMDVPYHPEP